jgi:hypothetical protein
MRRPTTEGQTNQCCCYQDNIYDKGKSHHREIPRFESQLVVQASGQLFQFGVEVVGFYIQEVDSHQTLPSGMKDSPLVGQSIRREAI